MAFAPQRGYVLIVADDAALRRRLPGEIEQAGLAAYVAHGVADAIDLAQEAPPGAVVLDLVHGSEDAWRRIKPAAGGSRLIVGGKFTARSVADRLQSDCYVSNGNVSGIMEALLSLDPALSPVSWRAPAAADAPAGYLISSS
jgi:ActR/RegA family two-component response regulator